MSEPTAKAQREALHAAPPGIQRLVKLLAILRGPGGCPWDQRQTHASLAPHLIEETYELVEALDGGEPDHIAEELGDVLLQVVFHAQLGAEAGRFDLDDVAQAEVDKMVARHPHVFADQHAETAEDVRRQWEARKRQDKPKESLASGVPAAMPGLTRAQTITARAADLGFDWRGLAEVFGKLDEELSELHACTDAQGEVPDPDRFEDELGDALFVLVNVARKAGLDAERALRRATDKFVTRFDRMEPQPEARWTSENRAADWDRAWEAAKHLPESENDASS